MEAEDDRLTVLKVKEFQAQLESREDHNKVLSSSTKSSYKRYQKHWAAWCDRKGYKNYRVECPRFLMYMKENLAENPDFANGNPQDAILPL
ncbi:hypothetical protein BGX21_007704, partial [Mortierella sp. AD011]